MNYYHRVFKTFSKEVINSWFLLEQTSNSSIFSSYDFHLSLNKYLKSKNLIIYIIYKENSNEALALIPLEKTKSIMGEVYIIHNFKYLDHINIIYNENTNIQSLAKYIATNILDRKELFISTCDINDKFIKYLISNTRNCFKWKNNNRYIIPKEDYEEFFRVHKRLEKRIKRSIKKYNITIESITETNKDLAISLNEHINFKTQQFKRTYTRNIFSQKNFLSHFKNFIKDNYKKVLLLRLVSGEKEIDAVLICYISRTELCYYQPSYRKDSKVESPGKILMYEAIKYAYKHNLVFDFSTGDEIYKKHYSTRKYNLKSIYLTNKFIPNFIELVKYRILYSKNIRMHIKKLESYIKKILLYLHH